MPAVGCLIALVLIALGGAAGAMFGGTIGAYWGCFAGLTVGAILTLVGLGWFGRVRNRLS